MTQRNKRISKTECLTAKEEEEDEESQFLAWPIMESSRQKSRTGSCEGGVLEPFASP